jgi:8-oxo-dGTP pyrophosphatase MutT (NUDIX family)
VASPEEPTDVGGDGRAVGRGDVVGGGRGRRRPRQPRRQRIAVYGICRNAAGDLLLTRAAAHLTVAGRWFLPGGGVDHGEHPEEALRRELTEETGLDGKVGELLGVLSDRATLPDGTDLHTVRLIYRITAQPPPPDQAPDRPHDASPDHRVAQPRGDAPDPLDALRPETGGSTDEARWFTLAEAFSLPVMPYVTRALTELARFEAPPRSAR